MLVQYLDRDLALERAVEAPVHDRHPPLADLLKEVVFVESLPDVSAHPRSLSIGCAFGSARLRASAAAGLQAAAARAADLLKFMRGRPGSANRRLRAWPPFVGA
jgi:hypothetical protein